MKDAAREPTVQDVRRELWHTALALRDKEISAAEANRRAKAAPAYLSRVPKAVPAGVAVVHNHIRPTQRLGSRGFRAWTQAPDPEQLEACPCEWAPWLGEHFRVRAPEDEQ